ncbi:hypothetical protein QTJ16_007116 [Diplocarpon rosae]|uniref:Chitin-binding type-1 domain-containing protein n=1 Tax=Diplocarpon rosae TaxID=946125 RepID=A0AAD9SUA3_9HELO|nr:hypothetical protein QTJ16_007116 [Diplocarpon rosae]PBP26324.1 endoglucanase [Diplocarpon rosae]
MRVSNILAAVALTFRSAVTAHMEMSDPIPFRSTLNTHSTQHDSDLKSPLQSGQGLCKGYEVDFADASGAGTATAKYTQGETTAATMKGGAVHNGGSCQISLSTDIGKSFTVIQSIYGCPTGDGEKLPFTIPSDAPLGRVILSWSWISKSSGVPEFYQDCAAVEIAAASSGATPKVPFSERPGIFVANIALANGCTTKTETVPEYPNPGPDVTGTPTEDSTTGCSSSAVASPAGASPAPGSSASSGAPASSATAAPSASSPTTLTTLSSPAPAASEGLRGGNFTSIAVTTGSTAPASIAASAGSISTGTPSTGAIQISTDGSCGSDTKCPGTSCCSSSGWCGTSALYCGVGCLVGFGQCAGNSTVKARGLLGKFRGS